MLVQEKKITGARLINHISRVQWATELACAILFIMNWVQWATELTHDISYCTTYLSSAMGYGTGLCNFINQGIGFDLNTPMLSSKKAVQA